MSGVDTLLKVTLMAPKPRPGFHWNLESMTMSCVWPHVQIHVALPHSGWSGRTS